MFFRYFDYEYLLNSKYQLIDVINAVFSKEKKSVDQKNIYSKSLLSTIFHQSDNVVINENSQMENLINEILLTKNKNEKFIKFNKLRAYINTSYYNKENNIYTFLRFINTSFEDFFKDYYIKNSILPDDDSKDYFTNILINIYKYIMVFPNHTKIYNDKNNLKMLTTKVNSLKLSKRNPDFLKGDQNQERLNDYTSTEDIKIYIASIDSYYYIYKKFNIDDKNFQLMIEIYNYLDDLNNSKHKTLETVIIELSKIIKYTIKQYYSVDIDNIFN